MPSRISIAPTITLTNFSAVKRLAPRPTLLPISPKKGRDGRKSKSTDMKLTFMTLTFLPIKFPLKLSQVHLYSWELVEDYVNWHLSIYDDIQVILINCENGASLVFCCAKAKKGVILSRFPKLQQKCKLNWFLTCNFGF